MKTEKQFALLTFAVIAGTLILAGNAMALEKGNDFSNPWSFGIFLVGGTLLEVIDRASRRKNQPPRKMFPNSFPLERTEA